MCGLQKCPLYDNLNKFHSLGWKKDVEAPSPPHYMISWKNYPDVAIGPSLALGGLANNAYEMSLEDFITVRANELRTYQVKGIRNSEELALSTNTLQFDVRLKTTPKLFQLNPQGVSAPAESISTSETPKVPGKVYSLVDSHDIKAQSALMELEEFGFDYMVQVLSTGNLGLPTQRKMVPTRWAITAVDSSLAKSHFQKIRGKPQINNIEVYESHHWDNHFLVILVPWGWAFEMLESWYGGVPVHDHEYGRLKKDYAKNVTGAYYAARLEILKSLYERGRLATGIVIRWVGKKYVYPVGVWHIRDAVKRALAKSPKKFESFQEVEMEYPLNWSKWKEQSVLWKMLTKQSKLSQFGEST